MKNFLLIILITLQYQYVIAQTPQKNMSEMWGGKANTNQNLDSERGKIFREGRYAMFIHWGLYSKLANQWKDKTYYGIGEWIMNPSMANISVDEYKKIANTFNPQHFNADEIVKLAKDAGMKYIVFTSKHHEGFAMFNSKDDDFNIMKATPFGRDPLKELADACQKAGIGLGFYYSQFQDWTAPGGNGGPQIDENGKEVSFDEYFQKKCLPQVNQITTEYGPIALIWFDTPGDMDKKYAQALVDIVHKNQPGAFVSSRVGAGLGDYTTLGDMEIPIENEEGLWETVETTNDSWAYAWYDYNWKSPKKILTSTLSTIARGGNFMLNVGPDKDGIIPLPAQKALRNSGEWIKKYPNLIYKGQASPWKRALPWGDAIIYDNKLYLTVSEWPKNGKLHVPGITSKILKANLLKGTKKSKLSFTQQDFWTVLNLASHKPEKFVSVIELTLDKDIAVDNTFGIDPDPEQETRLDVHFANVQHAEKYKKAWMEKFGEWKHQMQVDKLKENSRVEWTVDIHTAGYYQTSLFYSGKGRVEWKITSSAGNSIQNEQAATEKYSWNPIGWLKFDKPGRYTISVSLIGDKLDPESSLAALKLQAVEF